jgi:hypothetical protein
MFFGLNCSDGEVVSRAAHFLKQVVGAPGCPFLDAIAVSFGAQIDAHNFRSPI